MKILSNFTGSTNIDVMRDRRLWVIILAGLIVRLIIGNLDPYLHDWDERFHALVAKNMLNGPFTPRLYLEPVFSYKIDEWCCNHVWLHKQPLFLWLMAISIKLFGVNVFAIRLSSILLSAIQPILLYDIAYSWTKNKSHALLSALFMAFSFFSILLTSGSFHTDHNDAHFGFFVLASFWCLIKYLNAPTTSRALLIGVFCGFAVLVKWLVGLLVLGVWFVVLFKDLIKERRRLSHFLLGVFTCILVFLPWQIYTFVHFPNEAQQALYHNALHISTVVEGHSGGPMFYFSSSTLYFGSLFFLLLPLAIIFAARRTHKNVYRSCILLSLGTIYLFFSFIPKTKMLGFVYCVLPLGLVLLAGGVEWLMQLLDKIKISKKAKLAIKILAILGTIISVFRPDKFYAFHITHEETSHIGVIDCRRKTANTETYKKLNDLLPKGTTIINARYGDHVEAMFFSDFQIYYDWPNEEEFLNKVKSGSNFAYFKPRAGDPVPKVFQDNATEIPLAIIW